VVAAVRDAVEQWGWGAAASRLITGHMGPHERLEHRLAAFKRTEAALVCSTGYQANLAAIRGLAGPGDVVFVDKLNHASIIDACRGCGAVLRVFGHRDYGKLERLLDRSGAYRRRVIVTDSLFSMDGDFADLPQLVEIKRKYDALLCIDEAHATGIYGKNGRGLAEAMGVEADVDVVVGTLSKALGGIGGFIATRAEIVEWLINTAGAFIYTTALPPAACAAALAALDIVEREPHRRQKLLGLAGHLRRELGEVRGLNIGGSQSQIVPLVIGDAAATVRLADALVEEGLLVLPIRPPTVPRRTARLRISLCCEHRPDDVDRLVAAIDRNWRSC
jgi:8-amino-7-oxononanoate synthase